MFIRSLILLGLCSALGMASPAFADVKKPAKTTQSSTKSAKADAKIKKKLTPEERAKEKAEAKAKQKEAIRQAKLAQMRENAKKLAKEKAEARMTAQQKLADERAKKKEAMRLAAAEKREKATTAAGDEVPTTFSSLAARKNKPVTGLTAERIKAQEAAAVGADEVLRRGNNGELRSAASVRPSSGFFQILFGDEPTTTYGLLPETRALDSTLEKKKKFKVRPEFEPQSVNFTGYPRGTIVIDTNNHFLYLVESSFSARRYGIAVGREGLQFKGKVAVGDKQEWPRWIPTKEMQMREPKKYGQYKDGMPGGGQNPLGARAIYLYQGKQDTHLRIHGTIAPESIGTNSSNGCFRMVNDHVIDLYGRVGVGTQVVIL